MSLPPDARERLASPLRGDLFSSIAFRETHTLPVPAPAWHAHSEALGAAIIALASSVPAATSGFDECRRGIEATKNHAINAVSHLLALQPFVPFAHEAAEHLLGLVTRRLTHVADQIEAGVDVEIDHDLLAEAGIWLLPEGSVDVKTALREAFCMEEAPVDLTGEFRPDWVLGHYAYRTNDLLQHLLPHLASLGFPGLTDVLAAISVVGEVLACIDPVTAYVEMDAMVGALLSAEADTRAAVREHLARMEPAILRARTAAARSSQTIRDASASDEVRANALADAYKRLVEGPFRQYAWALFCLNSGTWQKPPTLSELRDRLVAPGAELGIVTAKVVISELRNGEAHETLTWDGFIEQFVTDGVQIAPQDVVASTHFAQCFVAGFEAGLAVVRFLDLPSDVPPLPNFNELGRMPAWRRVQAFFGTNRLRLVEASLNTKNAALRVERLSFTDVNPCFQALVLSLRLMPNVESFAVYVVGEEPVITVAADALTAVMPVWEFAVSNFDQIPLAAFLSANLDARRRHEAFGRAVRSVAWIAVDDAVDVIDGSPDVWVDSDRILIEKRLYLVELAVRRTEEWIGPSVPRLRSVAQSVTSLREWIVDRRPSRRALADRRAEMTRLRTQWQAWGPVRRHPMIPNEEFRDLVEQRPQLREVPEDLSFRLL